jgi:hypothetical protein
MTGEKNGKYQWKKTLLNLHSSVVGNHSSLENSKTRGFYRVTSPESQPYKSCPVTISHQYLIFGCIEKAQRRDTSPLKGYYYGEQIVS